MDINISEFQKGYIQEFERLQKEAAMPSPNYASTKETSQTGVLPAPSFRHIGPWIDYQGQRGINAVKRYGTLGTVGYNMSDKDVDLIKNLATAPGVQDTMKSVSPAGGDKIRAIAQGVVNHPENAKNLVNTAQTAAKFIDPATGKPDWKSVLGGGWDMLKEWIKNNPGWALGGGLGVLGAGALALGGMGGGGSSGQPVNVYVNGQPQGGGRNPNPSFL